MSIIKKFFQFLFGWILVSNRWKHLVGCFVVSLFGTALMGIGCAGGMEYKDVAYQHTWKAWDWLDILASLIGCVLAVLVHAGILALIVCC